MLDNDEEDPFTGVQWSRFDSNAQNHQCDSSHGHGECESAHGHSRSNSPPSSHSHSHSSHSTSMPINSSSNGSNSAMRMIPMVAGAALAMPLFPLSQLMKNQQASSTSSSSSSSSSSPTPQSIVSTASIASSSPSAMTTTSATSSSTTTTELDSEAELPLQISNGVRFRWKDVQYPTPVIAPNSNVVATDGHTVLPIMSAPIQPSGGLVQDVVVNGVDHKLTNRISAVCCGVVVVLCWCVGATHPC